MDVDCQQSAPEANLGQGLQMNEFRSFFRKTKQKLYGKTSILKLLKLFLQKEAHYERKTG